MCEKPGANFSVDETWSGVGENSSWRAAAAQARPPGTNRARPLRAAERQVRIRAMNGQPFLTIGGVMDGNRFVFILRVSALLLISLA